MNPRSSNLRSFLKMILLESSLIYKQKQGKEWDHLSEEIKSSFKINYTIEDSKLIQETLQESFVTLINSSRDSFSNF